MGYGAGFGSTADHLFRYMQAVRAGNGALAATLEQQAYAHTQQTIPDRATWQAIYDKIEATKVPTVTTITPPQYPHVARPPVVTPILPPPPSQLPGGSGGPVVVVPGTPEPPPPVGGVVYTPPPVTDGASGGAAGGGSGMPAAADVAGGVANLVASAKANPAVALAAVLAIFFALKGRGTRRW